MFVLVFGLALGCYPVVCTRFVLVLDCLAFFYILLLIPIMDCPNKYYSEHLHFLPLSSVLYSFLDEL